MVKVSVAAGLLLAVLCGPARGADGEIPAAAFAALPQTSDVELSPSGRLIAWRDESGPEAKVAVYDIGAKRYWRILSIPSSLTLRSLRWADDGTLLLEVSKAEMIPSYDGPRRRYTYFRTLAADLASGKTRMLLMSDGDKAWVTGADLIAWQTAVPHTVIMSTLDYAATAERPEMGTLIHDPRSDSGWISELYRVDTGTGRGKIIENGDQYTSQWVVDAQGTPVARSEWRPVQKQYLVEARSGLGWRRIFERDDGQELNLQGLSSDGRSIIATGPDKGQRIRAWAVALDGSGEKQVSPDLDADVESVITDRFSGAPVGLELGGRKPRVDWLDSSAEVRYESVARAFPGRSVAVYSHSRDGTRVVAEVQDRSHPPIYYLVDFTTHRAEIVGEGYPALDKVPLGVVRSITYPARDGTAIPAYLTLPPAAAPKNLPLVVLPHGGPEDHDGPGFDWLSQFFAVRGYAVLQPEFRGSTGYGEAFRLAGQGQWGGLMQNDLTDGVKAMIGQGIADPHRICIVGASYGGYAALAGAAFTPKLYACAVSINGVSDLPEILAYEKDHLGEESDAVEYWRQDIGSPFDRNVIELSPSHAAADVEAPVLLLHATDDTIVPISQSREMAAALTSAGKPVTLIELKGEDHWLSNAATRREVLEDTDRFLRRYLQ